MKTTIISIFLILSFQLLNAQWEWMNPLPQGNDLTTIKFMNDSVGFIIGANGTFLKTNDRGNTWQQLQITSDEIQLYDLDIFSDGIGYVIGVSQLNHGVALKTYDFGNTWILIKDTTNASFRCSHFINKDFGFISGGDYLLKTIDGGNNWTKIQISDNIISIYFVDSLNGYLGCTNGIYRRIWKTTDGGLTWSQHTTSQPIYAIYFIDQNNGYAAGYSGLILKTTDGGNTWITLPNSTSANFTSMQFINSNAGFIVGNNYILKTTNGGNTWTITTGFGSCSVFFTDSVNGYVVGRAGYILKTINSGTTWSDISQGDNRSQLTSIFFPSDNIGYATSQGSVIKTNDAGINWSQTNLDQFSPYNNIYFINDTIGYICGFRSGTNYYGLILRTINGGLTWDSVYSIYYQTLKSVYFINLTTGIAVGDNGLIIKTTDSGNSWSFKSFGDNYYLTSVYFINDSIGYVCGGNSIDYQNQGIIKKTTDGGETWTTILNLNTYFSFNSIFFVDENIGYVAGGTNGGGGIMKTIDGGTNWETKDTQFTQSFYLNSVFFIDEYRGFTVGSSWINQNGVILATENGGETWFNQVNYAPNILNSIYFVNDTTGYAVGDNGTILKTTCAGGLVTKYNPINIETNINLYPNPTNCKITISINERSKEIFVSIFNIQGKQIINNKYENQNKINIDVSNLLNGIYLVKVQTDNGIETRKLLIQ